jgi:cytochrome c-type biogenesis protein CcmF
MFMGSLIISVSAFQIIFTTSIPVINKVFNLSKKLAPPTDAIAHYNGWQLPFAIIIAILIAITQFFKYKKTEPDNFFKSILPSFILSFLFTIIVAKIWPLGKFYYYLLFFSSVFAVLANLYYWLRILKANIQFSGASIAHVGFGLILLGVLISTSKKQIISQNTSGISLEQLGKDFSNAENIMLPLGDTLKMGDYYLTYQGKIQRGVNLYYQVHYLSKTTKGLFKKEFVLNPIIQLNDKMGNVAEPATKHFINKDVYTHITYADLDANKNNSDEWKENTYNDLKIGDTIYTSSAIIKVLGINKDSINRKQLKLRDSDLALGLKLLVHSLNGTKKILEPVFIIRDNYIYPLTASDDSLNVKVQFISIHPETGKVDIKVSEKTDKQKDFIVLKAIIFPGINILWLGSVIMVIGSLIAISNRIKICK